MCFPSNVYLTGPMGEFEEFDEKELIIGDYDKEFQLVYQVNMIRILIFIFLFQTMILK